MTLDIATKMKELGFDLEEFKGESSYYKEAPGLHAVVLVSVDNHPDAPLIAPTSMDQPVCTRLVHLDTSKILGSRRCKDLQAFFDEWEQNAKDMDNMSPLAYWTIYQAIQKK